MRGRRGSMLIELLVAITASTAITGVGVGVLALLLRLDRGGREHVHHVMVLGRLAEQFREDAHAAAGPIESKRKDHWRLTLEPHRAVIYEVTRESIERIEMSGGKPVRQESYRLPQGSTARIDVSPDRRTASLTLAGSAAPDAAGREARIEARLGSDRRFSKAEGGQR